MFYINDWTSSNWKWFIGNLPYFVFKELLYFWHKLLQGLIHTRWRNNVDSENKLEAYRWCIQCRLLLKKIREKIYWKKRFTQSQLAIHSRQNNENNCAFQRILVCYIWHWYNRTHIYVHQVSCLGIINAV